MAAAGSVQVTGYRECLRALKKCEDGSDKALKDGLKKAADPVVQAGRSKISRFAGASLGTIGPRVTQRGVFVTQRKKKVTGRRGDFGALQMRVGLVPALQENESETVKLIEGELRKMARSAGL